MINIRGESKAKQFLKLVKRDRNLLLMFLPIIAYYVIFHYVPMTGAIISFKMFVPGNGIYFGKFVGLQWFDQFLSSVYAWRLIRNTLLISV